MYAAANGPVNVSSTGALVQANGASGFAIFSGYEMRPSDLRSARISIENAGPTARLCLHESDASNSFGPGDLTLMIFDESAHAEIYRGEIGGLPREGIDLGCFAPGERRTYRFAAILAIDSPHGGQGRGAGAVYEWRGTGATDSPGGR